MSVDNQTFIKNAKQVLCKILNNRKVLYLVVGGVAVNVHGYYRPTTDRDGNAVDKPDFDFWFQPHYLNYMQMLDAFDDLGFDTSRFREEAHPFPKSSFFRFKPEGYTLDFLPRIGDGFDFWECYKRRMISAIDGVEVSVIGLDDLIASKKSTGRKKDLDDIEKLEQIRRETQA